MTYAVEEATSMLSTTSRLPEGFHWGYATAAQQIEGGVDADGRGESIWDRFSREQKHKVQDGSTSDITCDSYHLWRDDVELLKQYRATGYRFSISWSRVIPLGGRDDPINQLGINYYSNLIDALLDAGITPFVTLYHWDFPQALQDRYGGWRNREVLLDFKRYARVCFDSFGSRVKNWITINEPYVIAIPGWYNGETAPGRCSDRAVSREGDSEIEPWLVGHHLMLAHAHAAKLYHQEYLPSQGGSIMITLNGDWVEPWDDSIESKQAAARKMAAAVGWFADPIFLGKESALMREMLGDRLPRFSQDEWELLRDSSDFYGCNTYTSNYVKNGGSDVSTGNSTLLFENAQGESMGEPCASDWLVCCPWGFRKHLNYLYNTYQKPIFVTECGYASKGEHLVGQEEACEDDDRVDFHIGYLDNLLAAVKEDEVDVRSYFGWTLLDNWEWSEGYIPRFGVTYVDFTTGKRYPKRSAIEITNWFDKHLHRPKSALSKM